AEDGIRDDLVTGVQTCALPICESAEMQFYAGMAEASSARLYALRAENRNAARSGVRGREHLLRAKALDADLADANLGLGLYNYYVGSLRSIDSILRFFMCIPGDANERVPVIVVMNMDQID